MIATRICIYSALVAVPCLAQSAENPPAGSVASTRRPKPATSDFKELRFPRDQDYVVATVDAEPITLGDLVRHIDERHYPGFAAFLAGPEGQLNSARAGAGNTRQHPPPYAASNSSPAWPHAAKAQPRSPHAAAETSTPHLSNPSA